MKGTAVLQQYNYAYGQMELSSGIVNAAKNNDQLARVESFFEENSQTGNTKQWEQRFGYNELGRISDVQEYQGTTGNQTYAHRFTYDRFGNQYRRKVDQSSNVPANIELASGILPIEIRQSTDLLGNNADIDKETNRFNTSTTNIVYDESGNVIRDEKFRQLNYQYDANGRMIKVSNLADQVIGESVYDGLGQRVATKVGDVWKTFVYDISGQIVAEYGGESLQQSSAVRYLFTDWQSSTRTITNAAGVVESRMDYTAFGEEISAGVGNRTPAQGYTQTDVRNRYALMERDEATGLDHTLWRKNENKAGRWTSPDPYKGSMSLGDPQSFNRYSYTQNDPVNFVDPSGLNESIVFIYPTNCRPNPNWETEADKYICDVGIHIMNIAGGSSGGGTDFGGSCVEPGNGPPQQSSCDPLKWYQKYAACWARCFNRHRLDNSIRDLGKSLGLSDRVSNAAANLTITASAAAVINQGLNATSFGKKPRVGLGAPGASPKGAPTSWQHTISGRIGRALDMPVIGRVGRAVGRASAYGSAGLLAFEVGFTQGIYSSCQATCALETRCN
jgi:RHS repeat-associated protein